MKEHLFEALGLGEVLKEERETAFQSVSESLAMVDLSDNSCTNRTGTSEINCYSRVRECWTDASRNGERDARAFGGESARKSDARNKRNRDCC